MREFLNSIRDIFFTNVIGDINIYTIISSIVKFIFVFIVLYYIYIIVKLIILDIKNIDFNKNRKRYYLVVYDLEGNSKKYILENYTTIGRNFSNDIVLNSDLVSNFHAEIIKSESSYYIVDKDSLNGTYLNGEFIDDNIELFNQDKLEIGDYKLVFYEEIIESTDKENTEE